MAKYAIVIVHVSAMLAITMFYLKVSYDRLTAVCQCLFLKIMINLFYYHEQLDSLLEISI